MKKILFLLLSTVAMYGQVPADATPLENIQITNNTTSTTATKVNVQENDGTINTKPISDLVNYLEFASAVNLPVTGEQGKLYLTKDNNRLYRFNGTIYQELTTDISGKEDIANKQNSLAVDGTNTKYPTVTAVNTGLALKANLASPALTGTPTAPTATTGTNTTQIATTAFVTSAISTADSGNVKLIGDQTIAGVKTFSNTSYPLNNGVQLNNTSNNSTYGAGALLINNNGQGFGSSILNNSTGYGLGLLNMSTGSGLQLQQSSNGRLISLNNLGAGIGISLSNTQTGTGIRVDGSSSGNNFISNQYLTGTGFNYVGQNNGLNTFTVDKLGATTATSFIKSSAPTTNILLAGGGDIAQNTAFNKNFGTTAGTVVEGGTLGSNAYTSTAYLPLSGGTVTGNFKLNGLLLSDNFTGVNPQVLNPTATVLYLGNPSLTNINYEAGTRHEFYIGGSVKSRFNSTGLFVDGTVTASPATLPNHVVVKSQLDAVANIAGTSGSYTPSLSNLTNISNSSFDSASYTKIGNVVTARVSLFITAVTPSVTAVLDFLLPVPRVSTNVTGIGLGSSFEASMVVNTNSNTTTARLSYQPLVSTNRQVVVMFQYIVD